MLGLCAMLVSLAMPMGLSAQTTTTGIVRGSVTDPDAAIVPGAVVTLTPASGNPVTGASGSDGNFRIAAPAGTYTLTVSMAGFATLSKSGVRVIAGQSITSDAKLIVGEETQTITVTSDETTVSVDADANASSVVIKGADLDALSDDPDELSSELTALAGPSAGPNGGQIYVDGFTGGQLPPKSSIREIRINQNPFSAQYDKLGFGRVEVFTKPGTDKIRGSLSVQGNDNVLNTSNPFLGSANSQPPYHTFFLLGNVTGPLSKWASYSLGGSRRTIQTNVIVDPTGFYSAAPDAVEPCPPGTLAGCANNGYPVSARAVFQPQNRFDFTPRLDLALGKKNVLTIRYQYEQNSTQNSGSGGNSLPETFSNSSSNENTIQMTDNQTINSKMVNETRFEYQRSTSNLAAVSAAPAVTVQGNFISGGASSQLADTVSTHIEVQNYTSIALQKHFIRFGGRLRTTGESSKNTPNGLGLFNYNYLLDPCSDSTVTNKPAGCTTLPATPCQNLAVSSYQCGNPSQFARTTVTPGKETIFARETDVGLYAEDDWKIKPNITLSAGIRYETENVISDHDVAPRLSFAYGIPRAGGKNPTTVIRLGAGIFYDRFALSDFLTNAQLQPGVQTQQTVLNPGANCKPGVTDFAGDCGIGPSARTTAYSLAPNLRSAYTMQAAVGVDQQLWKLGTISFNYLPSRGDHEFFTRVTNDTADLLIKKQYQSEGVFSENQFFVNGNIRTRRFTGFGYYAFNVANTNAGSSTFNPTSTDPRVDYGRAVFANKHYATIGASYTGPYRISLAPFLIAHSGTPYNITTGIDNNNDSVFNDRPTFANGTSANCSVASTFAANTGEETQIPINYCTGPGAVTFNLRIARAFGFGPKITVVNPAGRGGRGGGGGGGGFGGVGGRGRGPGGPPPGIGGPGGPGGLAGFVPRRFNLTLGAQAQNVFNDVNFAAPTATSSLTSTQFGKLTQLNSRPFGTPNAVRTITLQATLTF